VADRAAGALGPRPPLVKDSCANADLGRMSEPRRLRPRQVGLALLLGLALAVAVIVRVESNESAAGRALETIAGITASGDRIELRLDGHGHVASFDTHVRTWCRGGERWSTHWYPGEGAPVHFKERGRYVTTVERQGPPRQLAGTFEARLGHRRASGNLRMVARFYRGSRQVQACDSGWVPWAVGPRARQRMAFVATPRYLGAYYPAVPSLARHVSAKRRRFIERVDRACMREMVAPGGWTWHAYARARRRELRAIRRLGPAPQRARLYRHWGAEIARQVALERRVTTLLRRRDVRSARMLWRRVGRLITAANDIGQRFGLTVCTAFGPDRTPVPRWGAT
jgi:hypothetical protein